MSYDIVNNKKVFIEEDENDNIICRCGYEGSGIQKMEIGIDNKKYIWLECPECGEVFNIPDSCEACNTYTLAPFSDEWICKVDRSWVINNKVRSEYCILDKKEDK